MKNLLLVLCALLILSSCRKKEEDIAVESVTIDKGKTAEVRLGETLQLKATVLPENATSKEVAWNSSALSKATVSEGLVTPLEEGEALISATAGGVTDNCTVKILPKFVAVAGISLDPETVSIVIKNTSTIIATIAPENASDKTVVWSSDNENIATVSDGVITAMAMGTCQITAKSFSDQTKAAICAVTVVNQEIPVTAISLIPSANILVNETRELTVIFDPENTTHKNVTWSTSDAAIADVSANGVVAAKRVVTAKRVGSATITVTSVSNPDKTAACQITVTNQAVAVTGITAATTDTTIAVRTSFQLRHRIEPVNATHVTVTYESSDVTKATVSGSGLVTANAIGEASITVKSAADPTKMATRRLFIKARVTSITVSPNTASLSAGQKRLLTATVIPSDVALKTVTWSSSDPSKATVSNGGEVTAVALGKVRIIATARDGSNITGASTVTVVAAQEIPVTGISLIPSANILVNDTRKLTVTITPEEATNKNVAWSTSAPTIAEVSTAGVVAAKRVGTATITATSVSNPAKTATCAITVTNQAVAVTGITANPTTYTMAVGASFQLRHSITPANATNVNVTYVSSETAKALVSESGLVTARAIGQATITVKSAADPTKMATCSLTINPAPVRVQSITVFPNAVTLSVGQNRQLTATVLPANAANKTVTWSSADPLKATVSNSGEVTAVGAGQVVITATANDGSAVVGNANTATVTVLPRATSITITPENRTVTIGATLVLNATVLPADAVQTVTWSSGDPTKATINPTTGTVSGVGAGTVTITATATDGSGVTREVSLTVQALVSNAAITNFTIRSADFILGVPNPRAITTLNNVSRALSTNLTSVEVEITATEGAIIKIGTTDFSGQRVNCTNPVTFTVTEAGKTGSKAYTLTITPYNAATNPYGIYTAAHLHDVRNALNAGFKLMNDITLPAASAVFAGIPDYATKGWLPIGDKDNPFTGSMDGGGHTIDNFFTDRTVVFVGLFGKVGAASIKDLSVNGVHGLIRDYAAKGALSNTNKFVGILAGYNAGTIENCHASGNVYSLGNGTAEFVVAGGLVGYCIDGTLNHCSASGRVSASSSDNADAYAGGLAGYCDGNINDSYATGKVSSFSASTTTSAVAGGLLGLCYRGNVIRCYATGEVSSISSSRIVEAGAISGGLVGHCHKETVIHINNCFATGEVTATCVEFYAIAGGLLGYRKADNSRVSNSYATGNITALCPSKYFHAGGLVGENHGSTIYNCYWNSNASIKKGDDDAAPGNPDLKGTPKPLTEMQNNAFTNSLGASVWGRDSRNNGLPYIKGVGVGK